MKTLKWPKNVLCRMGYHKYENRRRTGETWAIYYTWCQCKKCGHTTQETMNIHGMSNF